MVQPQFNGELWEGYFEPSLEINPGLYQIRGRTTEDTGRSTNVSRTTPWVHLLDIQVFNNAPEIREVIFSNVTLQRNQETSLKLNITDLEASANPEKELFHIKEQEVRAGIALNPDSNENQLILTNF